MPSWGEMSHLLLKMKMQSSVKFFRSVIGTPWARKCDSRKCSDWMRVEKPAVLAGKEAEGNPKTGTPNTLFGSVFIVGVYSPDSSLFEYPSMPRQVLSANDAEVT